MLRFVRKYLENRMIRKSRASTRHLYGFLKEQRPDLYESVVDIYISLILSGKFSRDSQEEYLNAGGWKTIDPEITMELNDWVSSNLNSLR